MLWILSKLGCSVIPRRRSVSTATHPLQPIRQYVDTVLTALSPKLEKLYAQTGRPSIATENLLRAL